MSKNNICVVLEDIKSLSVKNRAIPTPKEGEVQVAVKACGICCTDVHFYHEGGFGDYRIKNPVVMGHEAAGLVTAVGDGVTNVKVGDRVCIEPGLSCRRCRFCKTGRYNLCPETVYRSRPPDDGLMCQYVVHPADFVHKISDSMTWVEGALCEPMACAVTACRRTNLRAGDQVLILGAGPIGLLIAMTALANGASRVVLVDIVQSRLDFAEKLFGNQVTLFLSEPGLSPKQTAELLVARAFRGQRPEIAMECCGAESALQTAIYATNSGGVVLLVGLYSKEILGTPIMEAFCREIDIVGMFGYAYAFPAAVSMIASGRVDPAKIVTHVMPLRDGIGAFEIAANPIVLGATKVIVDCDLSD